MSTTYSIGLLANTAQIYDLNGDGDIQIIAQSSGAAGNLISWQYVDDVTAGNEYFSVTGNAIVCHIQSGVSTDDQVANEYYSGTNNPSGAAAARALISFNENIGGGIPQNTLGPIFLTGGSDGQQVASIFAGSLSLGAQPGQNNYGWIGVNGGVNGQTNVLGVSLGLPAGYGNPNGSNGVHWQGLPNNQISYFDLLNSQYSDFLQLNNGNRWTGGGFFQFNSGALLQISNGAGSSINARSLRLVGTNSIFKGEAQYPGTGPFNLVWDPDGTGDIGMGTNFASATLGDLTWYWASPGDNGNGKTITYVNDSPSYGYVTVDGSGNITLHFSPTTPSYASHAQYFINWSMVTAPGDQGSTSPPAFAVVTGNPNNPQVNGTATFSGGSNTSLQRPKNIWLAGNINLVSTTSTVGQIVQNGVPILHTYGSDNLILGAFAGNFSITGNQNVILGNYAAQNLNNGSGTTIVGRAAGFTHTGISGMYMTAVGWQALHFANSTVADPFGDYDVGTAIGYDSLVNVSTGNGNTAVGSFSGSGITTGSRNVAMGTYAASTFNDGNDNVGLGWGSLTGIASVNFAGTDRNTAVGSYALSGVNATSGTPTMTDNTALGYNAGGTHLNYTQSVLIGSGADTSVDNLTNAIVIGYGASVGISNFAQIGNSSLVGLGWSGYADMTQITTPSNPASGHNRLYFKSDNNLYILNSSGVEINVNNDSISTQTGTYSVHSTDSFLLANCTGGNVTFNLPSAATFAGKAYYMKKVDSSGNSMTIQAYGAELIDNSNTLSTTVQYAAFSIVSDGTQWWVF